MKITYGLGIGCVALVAIGCGDSGPDKDQGVLPDSITCTTGCVLSGLCQAGNSPGACGKNGEACATCSATEQCAAGTCVPKQATCTPQTCPGCCDLQTDTCKTPNTDFCGTGGGACSKCGQGFFCDAGACLDGNEPWKVTIVSVDMSALTGCDLFDECDTFAIVSMGTRPPVTAPEQTDTYMPVWNHPIFNDALRSELLSLKMHVELWDADTVSKNEKMTECDVQTTASHLTAGEATFAGCGTATNLKFKYEKVP